MKNFDQQAAFDDAVRGIIKQGGPSVGGSNRKAQFCRYRGDGDTACAIGQLIPDTKYSPEMEGQGIEGHFSGVTAMIDDKYGCALRRDLEFLSDLQCAHDSAERHSDNNEEFLAEFVSAAKDVALKHLLSSSVAHLEEGAE